MAVTKHLQRKVVEISWSSVVKGASVSISAAPVDQHGDIGDPLEKTVGKNDGFANLTFPGDFTGQSYVQVRGSHSGEEHGTIHVE